MTDNRGNTGNNNTGHRNTGYGNTGYRNTGSWNTGNRNTGNINTGYRNTGSSNTGYRNTGSSNTGNWNTGNWNTGNWNTGDWNTGNWNTGDSNTGRSNTGHRNTGSWNTGSWNTGSWNTGNWNVCDRETGFFNTQGIKTIRVFNKDCAVAVWDQADKPCFLHFDLTEWIREGDMTDQEKIDHTTFRTTGGFLKVYDYKEAFQKSWDEADEEDRAKLFKLPNFDAEVFKEISGIDVTEKPKSCAGKIVEIDGKKYTLKEVK